MACGAFFAALMPPKSSETAAETAARPPCPPPHVGRGRAWADGEPVPSMECIPYEYIYIYLCADTHVAAGFCRRSRPRNLKSSILSTKSRFWRFTDLQVPDVVDEIEVLRFCGAPNPRSC